MTAALLTLLKIGGATGVITLGTVELGAEFFTAVNTTLNLLTMLWISRQSNKVRAMAPKVEHIHEVADQLDASRPGGRREYDPSGNGND